MRSLFALSALVLSLASHAAPLLDYSPQLDAEQERMVHLYVRTRTCLGDAARAALRTGEREPANVEHFMVSVCGNPFYQQLRRDGMPEEQARRTLVALTQKALYEDVLHQRIPD